MGGEGYKLMILDVMGWVCVFGVVDGAIHTDVYTHNHCHFDRREKSAVHPLKAQSRFLPAVEMTILKCDD